MPKLSLGAPFNPQWLQYILEHTKQVGWNILDPVARKALRVRLARLSAVTSQRWRAVEIYRRWTRYGALLIGGECALQVVYLAKEQRWRLKYYSRRRKAWALQSVSEGPSGA